MYISASHSKGHLFTIRNLTMFVILLIVGSAAYGFAAANTFTDAGAAGEGQGVISGYIISDTSYRVNTTTSTVEGVMFRIKPDSGNLPPKFVSAKLSAAAGYTTCSAVTPLPTLNPPVDQAAGENVFECDFTAPGGTTMPVTTAASLFVLAWR